MFEFSNYIKYINIVLIFSYHYNDFKEMNFEIFLYNYIIKIHLIFYFESLKIFNNSINL